MISNSRINDLINTAMVEDYTTVTSDEVLELTNGYSAWKHCMKKLRGHICPVKCWSEDNDYEYLDMKKNIGWLQR